MYAGTAYPISTKVSAANDQTAGLLKIHLAQQFWKHLLMGPSEFASLAFLPFMQHRISNL